MNYKMLTRVVRVPRTGHIRPVIHARRPMYLRPLRSGPEIVESLNTLANSSYYVSKGIILFTLFYCSMNWWHYRSLREELEDKDDKKK